MWPFRKKRGEILNHWIAAVEGYNFSPQTFYGQLEEAISARKISDLSFERTEFSEGTLLSNERTYLRIRRERLMFDICAAPFGTAFFFSCRTTQLPTIVGFWRVAVVLVLFGGLHYAFVQALGLSLGTAMLGGFLVAALATLYNAATLEKSTVDSQLAQAPILGTIYEAWFRQETYYRTDTRLMYLELVPHVVREMADEVTAARGVRLVRQYEQAPILGELYKPVTPRELPQKA